jgi:hypothetical protein
LSSSSRAVPKPVETARAMAVLTTRAIDLKQPVRLRSLTRRATRFRDRLGFHSSNSTLHFWKRDASHRNDADADADADAG